jgi:hypothetical protein
MNVEVTYAPGDVLLSSAEILFDALDDPTSNVNRDAAYRTLNAIHAELMLRAAGWFPWPCHVTGVTR